MAKDKKPINEAQEVKKPVKKTLDELKGQPQFNTLEKADKEAEEIKDLQSKTKVKGKGGRPSKSDDEKASEQIFVNLTKAEKKQVEARAKKMGFNQTAPFVKFCLAQQGAFE